MALSAHSARSKMTDYLIGTSAILLAIINRLISFLVCCVGLQIAITGIKSILNG